MRTNHSWVAPIIVGLSLLLAANPPAAALGTSAGGGEPFDGDEFYAVPGPLPEGEPGTLLRYEPIDIYGRWDNFADHLYSYALALVSNDGGDLFFYRDAGALRADGERDESVGQSAAELAFWLAAHPGLQPTTPIEVTVGGLDGFQVDLATEASFTEFPPDCPPDEVCVPMLESGAPVDPWGFWMWGRDDAARVILLDTSDGGNVAIYLDPWDWARTDADAFYHTAQGVIDSIDFTATAGDPTDAACPEDWGGSCRGLLAAGDPYATVAFEPAFGFTAASPEDAATAWRIMYLSESIRGDPIAVTGMAIVPAGPAPDGGRAIVSVAHGTTGVADDCAPSKDPHWDLVDSSPFVNSGHLVVITDYEGLGTPGRHPYLVGVSEGRGVLDAPKAASQLPGTYAGEQLAIWGHSQGGHAALWAAELAAEWSPEFDVVGVVAAAPATELELTGEGLPPEAIGYVFLAVAGFDAAYDDIDPSLRLTAAGEEELAVVDELCVDETLDHFARLDPDELLQPPDFSELWTTRVAENDPGQAHFDAPVLIVDADDDEIIPTEAIDQLHERMCGLGHIVERRSVEGDHGDAWWDALQDGADWFEARLAGEPPESTC